MQGDQEPGKEPGDIVIQLEEKEHPTFQRHGKDLTLRLDIDVSEALCGMRRSLKTLDNRNIALVTKPGEIIKQADIKMIQGEGMPTFRVTGCQVYTVLRLILLSRTRLIRAR